MPKSWWRRASQRAVDRVVAGLRWRFGLDQLNARVAALERRVGVFTSAASAWAVSSWIEQAHLETTPLVSVILATRNRSKLLPRAVESVALQKYPKWEIVLVDDGSTDDTPAVVRRLSEHLGAEKLRGLRISQSGVCAARNRGLDAARGEVVAYLDDDNTMDRLWLKAVVWAFSQRPDIDVVYGGFMVDDLRRLDRRGAGDLPSFHLNAFDRVALQQYNIADIGAIAHRKNLPEARFDETLRSLGDWDLLLRLTRQKPPLVLPAIACYYTTSAPDRPSEHPSFAGEIELIQKRLKK